MQLWFLGYMDWSFKSFSLIKLWVQNWVSTHVDLVFLIWPLDHSRCLGLPSSMYSEKVSPTPYLVVSKSLNVTSIMVLKMNWSIKNSTSSFHTLVFLGSRLYYHLDAPLVSERGNACKVCFSSSPFISAMLRYLLMCCFGSPILSNFFCIRDPKLGRQCNRSL